MDFSKYKFRCSGLGQLMVNPKNKKELLSVTTKSYLRDIYIKEIYGREKDTTSKYTEKGLYVEEDSLGLMQQYYNRLLIKNKKTYENDYIKGTPDIVIDRVVDAKSSWDIFTFYDADGNNKDYSWQLLGYMCLTEKVEADLAYCLNNAPEHLIVDEKQRQMYKRGLIGQEGNEKFIEMEAEIEKNMTFDDIPENKRIKVFSFNYDPEKITKLYERIEICRDYLSQIKF